MLRKNSAAKKDESDWACIMKEPRQSQRRGKSNRVLISMLIVATLLFLYQRSTATNQETSKSESSLNVAELNRKTWSTDDLLRWAVEEQFDQVVDVTSFGPSGLVILHKLFELDLLPRVPIVTIDTLHLFNETYRYIRKLQIQENFPGMQVHIYKPKHFQSKESFDAKYGHDLWQKDITKYNSLSKTEPLSRALDDFRTEAWITGRRRSQGGERSALQPIEIDPSTNKKRYKINPLYTWTYEDVWQYIHTHKIPYNPLHDAGYKSIGDTMTSTPVSHDAPERSGRFVGLDITECGIHKHLVAPTKKTQQLPCSRCIEIDNLDSLLTQYNYKNILLEIFSPLCGGCRAFAPTFDHVVQRLPPTKFHALRYDTTRNGVPANAHEILGHEIRYTPTLFLIRNEPSFKVLRYQGKLQTDSLLEWLGHETENDDFV